MKKLTTLFAVAGTALLLAAPAQAITTFATNVYVDPGVRTDGNDNEPGRDNPSNALGNPGDDFWSMGRGGISVFAFSPPNTFNEGVVTIEETFGCSTVVNGQCSNYAESANLFVYDGVIDFNLYDTGDEFGPEGATKYDFSSLFSDIDETFVGEVNNGAANESNDGAFFDLNAFGGNYLYVILQDTSSSPDGFDIKSVSVSAVPLPPAVLAFGAALGLMGFIGRRRKKAVS